MAGRSLVRFFLLCSLLSACAGEKRGATDGGSEALDATVDAGDGELSPGDPVDLDGDGTIDGEAVDPNDDGVVDGVDTDGDGDVDAPLPNGATPSIDGGADAGAQEDGGVWLVTDSGATPFPVNDAGQVLCGTEPCGCSNGLDDDMDGVSDLADPECVSAWDDDEASFATGIAGDNRDDACQDCFFDGNSGAGDDGCRLPSSCLSMGNASSGRGGCNTCEQTAQCKNFCKAYTPNGCDCFGCCTVRLADDSTVNVALGNGCNIDGSTVTGCNTCVPNDSCRNECGECELCPGKTLADLPAECFQTPPTGDAGTSDDSGTSSDGGPVIGDPTDSGTSNPPPPGYSCDDGATVCGAGLSACASGYSCSFGCCVLTPVTLF